MDYIFYHDFAHQWISLCFGLSSYARTLWKLLLMLTWLKFKDITHKNHIFSLFLAWIISHAFLRTQIPIKYFLKVANFWNFKFLMYYKVCNITFFSFKFRLFTILNCEHVLHTLKRFPPQSCATCKILSI